MGTGAPPRESVPPEQVIATRAPDDASAAPFSAAGAEASSSSAAPPTRATARNASGSSGEDEEEAPFAVLRAPGGSMIATGSPAPTPALLESQKASPATCEAASS